MRNLSPREQGIHDASQDFEYARRLGPGITKQQVTEHYLGPEALDFAMNASNNVLDEDAGDEDREEYRLGWILGMIDSSQ